MTILSPRVRAIGKIYGLLILIGLGLLGWGVWRLLASPEQPQLQGMWQSAGLVVDFQADGLVVGLADQPLRYEVLSASELRLIAADSTQQTATYALLPNELTLVLLNQQKQTETLHLQRRVE